MRVLIACFFFLNVMPAFAQDTQFPKTWELHLRLQNGMITEFHSLPDLYAGGLVFAPQYGIIPHRLRIGAVGGLIYAGKKLNGIYGASASLKLKSLETKLFGFGNLHVTAEHLWGTNKIRLAGGGPYIELAHRLLIGLTAHRDYRNNTWWFQSNIAIKLNKMKTDEQDFNR
jgi:hypothetical protein